MKIFVGLGNPGAKYARNRHNIGFMAVDRIASDHGFGPWRARFQGMVAEGRLGTEKVLLLKPATFMNLSGQSVGEAMRFLKSESTDITVFHDEIDLAPGRIRLKAGGGHAGHNGLRSIQQHIGPHFDRVRMGVGHPGHKDAVPGYVLHDFPKADENWLDDLMRGISDGAVLLAAGEGAKFLNAIGLRMQPSGAIGQRTQPSGAAAGKARPPHPDPHPDPEPKAAAVKAEPRVPSDPPAPEPDTRSAWHRLADRFR